MLGPFARSTIALLLVSSLLLSSCAYMSKSGRQQMAHAHYVKKYSHNRSKQKTKFRSVKTKMPTPPRSQNAVNASTSDSPQSVTSGGN